MNNKVKLFTAAAVLAALLLSGCGAAQTGSPEDGGKLRIVCTVFPEYDWVKNILGDKAGDAELTLLLDKGVDLHSYQPTADDIIKISTCDLFVYVGGESDAWMEDALAEAVNGDMKVINLMDVLGESVKEEEVVEGMQEERHDHADHEEGPEYDEHIWLSLRNASALCEHIAGVLSEIDGGNAATYSANTEAYIEKLAALDGEYRAAVDGAKEKTVVFGDRFPFRYLMDDYGLDYYAAFPGCSAETEASFETVAFLAGKVDELGLPAVLTMEGEDHRIAQTIAQNTKVGDKAILTMDSMQSVTDQDVAEGLSYLSVMQANLQALSAALN